MTSPQFNESDHPRNSDGTGRFAEKAAEDPGNDVLIRRHPVDVLDDPRVVAALGGAELDDYEKQGLRMLLDPANDPFESCTDLDDILEEFEGRSGTDVDEDMTVGRWLEEAYSKTEGYGGFGFELVRDPDGSVSSFNVYRSIPDQPGMFQGIGGDVTELASDKGLAGAAKTAGALIYYHDQIKAAMDGTYPPPGCEHTGVKMSLKIGGLVCLDCGALIN